MGKTRGRESTTYQSLLRSFKDSGHQELLTPISDGQDTSGDQDIITDPKASLAATTSKDVPFSTRMSHLFGNKSSRYYAIDAAPEEQKKGGLQWCALL